MPKYALVTGASAGLGLAIAMDLLAHGYSVFANGRSKERLEKAFADLAQAARERVFLAVGDASEEADVKRIIADVSACTGGELHALVNNAGNADSMKLGGTVLGAEDFSFAAFRDTLKTFVEGPALCIHYAAPLLAKAAAASGGSTTSVVNVSSIAAQRHLNGSPIYSAAKAALDSLTKSSAGALGPKGVRVNAVAPGPVLTELFKGSGIPNWREVAEAFIAEHGKKTVLGRAGKAEEVAALVTFLCEHATSSWITGSVYNVDGGLVTAGV